MPTIPDHVDPARAQRKARFVELAAALFDLLFAPQPETTERYYDGDHPGPYRTKRAFLDAGRRRDFPTMRVGKRVVALIADVHAAIESKPPRPKKAKSKDPLAKFDRRAA